MSDLLAYLFVGGLALLVLMFLGLLKALGDIARLD